MTKGNAGRSPAGARHGAASPTRVTPLPAGEGRVPRPPGPRGPGHCAAGTWDPATSGAPLGSEDLPFWSISKKTRRTNEEEPAGHARGLGLGSRLVATPTQGQRTCSLWASGRPGQLWRPPAVGCADCEPMGVINGIASQPQIHVLGPQPQDLRGRPYLETGSSQVGLVRMRSPRGRWDTDMLTGERRASVERPGWRVGAKPRTPPATRRGGARDRSPCGTSVSDSGLQDCETTNVRVRGPVRGPR